MRCVRNGKPLGGLAIAAILWFGTAITAQQPFAKVADEVNKKLVKLYGAGGFQGLASYGSGILVSPDGYVLTAASHMLDTRDLRAHLYDGRVFHECKVVVMEPALDAALVKIDKVEDLPYFDIAEVAKRPVAQAGDWILGFSNQFHIATRDEPMSVQQGVVQAYAKLHGRRGVFEAPYQGEVYVLDAITNNPGAAGGALTTRSGELLGILGKELRNSLTDTWMNYAVPIQAKIEVKDGDMMRVASIVEMVEKKEKYRPIEPAKIVAGQGGYHGIILVPSPVPRTPAFIEDILPESPAARVGLKPDDLIVYLDGEQVPSVKALNEALDRMPPGTEIQLEVRRSDRQTKAERLVTVRLKLEERVSKKN